MSRRVDLSALFRRQLYDSVRPAVAPGEMTVLLLDDVSRRAVSACATVSTLVEELSLALIANVHAPLETRAPPSLAHNMHAVYVMSPCIASVRALLDDLCAPRPVYGGLCHAFFSRALPAEAAALLAPFVASGRLATLREDAWAELVAIAPSAFSCAMPTAAPDLYGPMAPADREAELGRIASALASTCTALGDALPAVACAKGGHPIAKSLGRALVAATASNAAHASAPASSAASSDERGVSPAPADDRATPPPPLARSRPVSVLVLERSSDLVTPLMLDFSYEGLASAAGLLQPGGTYVGLDGVARLLGPSDGLWTDVRSRSLPDAASAIQARRERRARAAPRVARSQPPR